MKSLIIALASFAVFNLATCQYSSFPVSSSSDSARYLQYLRERSQTERLRHEFESLCPGKDDELDNALYELKKCSDQIDENSETACSAMKNHFMRCSKPMSSLLESCVPEESKGVPDLVFASVHSAVNYLCKTDGEHIFELANHCVYKTNYKTMRCGRRMRTKLQQFKKKSPTKSDICEFAQSMKPCLKEHLDESCGNAITKESFMGMFDAMMAPCSGVSKNQLETNYINEVEILDK
ncbi:uncharacterized protein LOC661814 [Tribolium castaneum]|uniref:Uncharacterized protein n=1 Tax=Tribolium castaneum TaxID=7070 RepID=D6X0M9_TRICA|nr:PREDICTED: uncharacterized protein LOC661814 [Tribolium castaneum]EFA10007.1 hypothetical protein TcasGA2_TC012177 [Tribolium castaneum]|eukprot:XP_973045.1 PREDICTED: uncharacterized protein LOC661814 [Tribolium castaneum]